MPLQIRRGTNAERLEETFALGELIYVTDEQKLIVGDGTTQGGIVVSTDVDTETVQNITANMFTEGTHTNIAFAYDTTAGTINASVDLSELDILDFEGVFRADGFQGSIFLDDSNLFLDAEFNTVFFDNVRTAGNIIPDEDLAYSIGDEDFRFTSIHASELFLDGALITSFDGGIDLPPGSTIDGAEVLAEGGTYRINIISQDSSLMVDSENLELRASIITLEDNIEQTVRPDGGISVRNFVFDWDVEPKWPVHQFEGALLVDSPYRTQSIPGELASSTITASTYRGSVDEKQSLELGDQIGVFATQAFIGEEGSEDDVFTSAIVARIEEDTAPGNNFPVELNFFTLDFEGGISGATLSSRGVFKSAVLKTGVYDNDAARDSRVGTPEKGMIIFNDDTGKFQGYNGTDWVDLS